MTATGEQQAAGEINRLLVRLTHFLLRNSAEGGFEVRDTVRRVAQACGAKGDVRAIAEGAVLTVRHRDDSSYAETVQVTPELARLDLVAEGKFLVGRIVDGELGARAANRALTELNRRPGPYPLWLRGIGVIVFAVGFAPSVQATWTEIGYSLALGAVMAVVFLAAERASVLRILLPIVGPLAVGELTRGAVRLAQAAFTLLEIALGIIIAAEVTGVGTRSLFESTVPRGLPYWLIVISWVPFVFGMALTFSRALRDIPWILVLTYLAWGVQCGVTRWVGPDAGTFIAAGLLAAAAGFLELSPSRPPRIVLILGGFFALTVGSVALRGLTTLDGGHSIQGFGDLRDAITQTAAITLGLIVGAVPLQSAAVRRRRTAAGGSGLPGCGPGRQGRQGRPSGPR